MSCWSRGRTEAIRIAGRVARPIEVIVSDVMMLE